MAGKASRRTNVPIELTDEAKDLVDRECESLGMTRKAMVEKLIRWYVAQGDVVRGSILGTIPESVRVDVARLALERLGGGPQRPRGKREGS